MGVSKSNLIAVSVLLTITAFSCSMPGFTPKSQTSAAPGYQPRPAKLSGVLDLKPECLTGYYEIKLQGIFDAQNVQVTSQTDEKGHFSLVAPPGHYLMMVSKGPCGSKQAVDLEENTEHMVSVSVGNTSAVEMNEEKGGRLPASVLILPKR